MSDVHSCSYYCTRPACVLAQRDELRDRVAQALDQSEQILRAIEQMKQQAEPVAWKMNDPTPPFPLHSSAKQAEPASDSGNPSF
jgi:hypothetical protein